MSAGARAELHRLIDDLDDEQAARLLQLVGDPLEPSLMLAPLDDEPLTEGEAAYQRGDWVADDDL